MTPTVNLKPDGLGGFFVHVDGERIGRIFPAATSNPGGDWFGKRYGTPARRFDTEHGALEYLAGRPVNLEEN